MSSRRLPGKVLMEFDSKRVLKIVIDTYRKYGFHGQIFVATSSLSEDDQIADLCFVEEIPIFRGSLDNVLARFYECAVLYEIDTIVRHTADNIFVDCDLLLGALNVEDQIQKDIPFIISSRGMGNPTGMDVEIFNSLALKHALTKTSDPYDLEHVTPYLYKNPEILQVKFNIYPDFMHSMDIPRVTLDAPRDVILLKSYLDWLEGLDANCLNCYDWWVRVGRTL